MKKVFLLAVVLLSMSYNFLCASSYTAQSWQNCKKIVSRNCGAQIHAYVFNGDKNFVSPDCCIQTVEMGKHCHDLFTSANVESSIYKSNKTYFLERSASIWKKCVIESKEQSAREKCPRMRDGKCGRSIVSSVFHNVGKISSNKCCGYLIRREKECHDSLVQDHLARGGFEHNKTQVLKLSEEVWNKCASVAQNLPDVRFCKSKVSFKCGPQIAQNVLFHQGSITKECCIQLLKAGRECHDLLALTDVALPSLQTHSKDILKRTAKSWIECRKKFQW